MSTERCYCLPGRCDAIVLFIAHYSISHPCYTIMFNSFEQIKWGGGSEGGGVIGISAFRSNRFALWLLSNSIFCQLASRTPTLEKKTRTTRAIYTLHSITHVSARAKGAHIDSHTVTNMARKLLCVFFYIFFLCVVFAFHLAGIQLTSIQGDFLIQCECICLHSSCAVPGFFASAHTNTNPHQRHFSASKKYLSTFFLLPV